MVAEVVVKSYSLAVFEVARKATVNYCKKEDVSMRPQEELDADGLAHGLSVWHVSCRVLVMTSLCFQKF